MTRSPTGRRTEGISAGGAFCARPGPMGGAALVVAAALAATGALSACGDADSGASSTLTWNACNFAGTLNLFENGREGAANTRWGAGDASQYTIEATSRCLYQASEMSEGQGWGDRPTLAVYARLSGLPTTTPDDDLRDLASAGYQSLASRPAPGPGTCEGEPQILASIQAKSDGGITTARTELHHFTTIRLESGISVYAYFVAALNGQGQDPTVADMLVTTTVQSTCEAAVAHTKAFFDDRAWRRDAGARDDGVISDGLTSTADASSERSLDDAHFEDAGQAGLPLEELSAQLAPAYCAKMRACCPGAPSSALSDCPSEIDLTLSVFQELAASGVRAGRLRYDGKAAATCLNDFVAAPCGDIAKGARPLPLLPCLDAVTPLQATGAPCTNSLECVDGACQIAQDAAATDAGPSPGLCTPKVPAGSACQDDAACSSGSCDTKLGTCRAAAMVMACTVP